MKIKWLGHASFLIETNGKKIITDPFDDNLGYPSGNQEADIVTVSHDHWDHNATKAVKGNPQVIRQTGLHKVAGIEIEGIPSFHDKNAGQERGKNIIYRICSEGMSIVHLGDLGHLLNKDHIKTIKEVDILLIPVGGTFTIDADEAFSTVAVLNPKIVIPMHFNTPHLSFELAPVEAFTSRYNRVVKKPYLEIKQQDLEKDMKVIILDYLS